MTVPNKRNVGVATTATPTVPEAPRRRGSAAKTARRRPTGQSTSYRRLTWRGHVVALLLAMPLLLTFVFFSWEPIAHGVVLAFQNYMPGVGDPTWAGWSNFRYVLGDPDTLISARNTVYYTILAIFIGFPMPLIMAVLITEVPARWRWLYAALAYIPVIIPQAVGVLLWRFFYAPDNSGLFNQILGLFGIDPQLWLNSPISAMPSIVIQATWASFGTTTIIYLAALTAVRPELYEAAELDGASIPRRIWHVTLPQIRGVVVTMTLLQAIGTMQVFTEPYLFTGGGPNKATLTVLMQIYNYAFVRSDIGAATALSVLLAGALGIFSILYFLVTRRLDA